LRWIGHQGLDVLKGSISQHNVPCCRTESHKQVIESDEQGQGQQGQGVYAEQTGDFLVDAISQTVIIMDRLELPPKVDSALLGQLLTDDI